jgi:hypothetical protein
VTPERLDVAIEVCGELGKLAADMPEEMEKALAMAIHLQIAVSYLVEFRVHVHRGCEPYDAMLKTARGDLPARPR